MCTGIKLKAKDNSVIFARTWEFGVDLDMKPIGIPAGKQFIGSAPENKSGLEWTGKYAALGANTRGMPLIVGGMNEKGLHFAAFNFSEFSGYQDVTPADYNKCLNNFEVVTYVLTTTATVDEGIAALKKVKVADMGIKEFNDVPFELHYRLADKSGRAVAIEYMNGELHVIENPLGTFANSPNLDWHLTNLTNYINLSAYAWPAVEVENLTLKPSSLGSGMAGMPGDFTSPSRFVRAVAFQETASPSATADECVHTASHLLNLFDIPKGASVQKAGDAEYADYTQMTHILDLTNLRYFFKTYENSQIRMIKMADFVAGNHTDVVVFARSGEDVFNDIAATAKPLR